VQGVDSVEQLLPTVSSSSTDNTTDFQLVWNGYWILPQLSRIQQFLAGDTLLGNQTKPTKSVLARTTLVATANPSLDALLKVTGRRYTGTEMNEGRFMFPFTSM
jgi:hypothetical protein